MKTFFTICSLSFFAACSAQASSEFQCSSPDQIVSATITIADDQEKAEFQLEGSNDVIEALLEEGARSSKPAFPQLSEKWDGSKLYHYRKWFGVDLGLYILVQAGLLAGDGNGQALIYDAPAKKSYELDCSPSQ